MSSGDPKNIQQYIAQRAFERWRMPLYGGGSIKEYQRAEKVHLPPPAPELPSRLDETLVRRKSQRTYTRAMTVAELSSLLYWAAGAASVEEGSDRRGRTYPSGGNFYPLEFYVIALTIGDLTAGVYHYHPGKHVLEQLPFAVATTVLDVLTDRKVLSATPSALVLTSFVEHRSHPKYGIFSNKLALLEAGHVGQNLYLVAAALQLRVCALGLGGLLTELNEQLRLDGSDESVIYGLALGA